MGGRKRKPQSQAEGSAGASSSKASGSVTKVKRRKKGPNVQAGQPGEKRLARFMLSCPRDIMERVDRVMTQRCFSCKRDEEENREEFKVLGSTGYYVYTVVIDKLPSCDCPDATKGNHCKHILFIFLKVLSVPLSSTLYYQKALLSTELETLFAQAPAAPNSLLHPCIQATYANATGRQVTSLESQSEECKQKKRRLPGEEDECPICYETMFKVNVKDLTFCSECGNVLHSECFQEWAKAANPLTCVWCRVKWKGSANTGSGSSSTAPVVSEA